MRGQNPKKEAHQYSMTLDIDSLLKLCRQVCNHQSQSDTVDLQHEPTILFILVTLSEVFYYSYEKWTNIHANINLHEEIACPRSGEHIINRKHTSLIFNVL